jgi:LPXTG-motif cell wall-anchored protein
MTLRRALTSGLFGLLLAAAVPAVAANAAPGPSPYPPGNSASLAVSATQVGVGATITVTGNGFPAGPVAITSAVVAQGFAGVPTSEGLGSFRSAGVQRLAAVACSTGVTCSATANSGGHFSVPFTLTQAGTTVITASGGGVVRSQTIQVGPSGVGGGGGNGGDTGGKGSLPNTGASLQLPLTLGGILVLGGAGLIAVVRRRKRGSGVAA